MGSLNHSIVPPKNDGDIKSFVAISAKSITGGERTAPAIALRLFDPIFGTFETPFYNGEKIYQRLGHFIFD